VLPAARPIPGLEAEAMVAIERARRHVADEAMAILREAGRDRDVQCEVAEGPVAREIAQRAEELAADLIVIGTAARRGVLGGLVATLGDRLARLAPCPVLAVPRIGARDARR
jgi:nucleotide-binding universal stress UspA family protein